MKIAERLKNNKIVLITILLSIIGTFFLNQYIVKDYSRVNNETTQFVSAKVTNITENNIKYDEKLDINLGKQKITVVFLEGDSKDKEVTLDNYLTAA
ncbi:MAG: YibE/F family protein, partial [Coprobacillus sp.]